VRNGGIVVLEIMKDLSLYFKALSKRKTLMIRDLGREVGAKRLRSPGFSNVNLGIFSFFCFVVDS
jgi:hypothetical protein